MEIVRNVTRHKLRSFLTIAGIVIGVLALTTMGAMAENFNALLDGGVKYFSSSIQVGPPDGQQSATLLPISKVDDIKKIDGVAAALPTYGFPAKRLRSASASPTQSSRPTRPRMAGATCKSHWPRATR